MRSKKQINVEIGARIKLAREQVKLTQEQFAEKIAVSPQYISDLERGVVGIAIPTLKNVCQVLGVSSDQILFGKTAEGISSVIGEKCKALTAEQYLLLLGIIDSYISAVISERKSQE